MNNDNPDKTLDQLLHPGSTLMVGTRMGDDLDFRPLTVARVVDARIEVLLDTNEEWVRSFQQGDQVYLTVSDTKDNTWISARGHGTTSADKRLIDELWNPFASAYFDNGRETPGIAVLTIEIDSGRYWSSPSGRLGSLISMIKAKVGRPEDSGEHGALDLGR